MNPAFQRLMRQASRLTSAQQLCAATTAIQRALRGGSAHAASSTAATPPTPPASPAPTASARPAAIVLDGAVVEVPDPTGSPSADSVAGDGVFIDGAHTHAALTRQYKLYVPGELAAREQGFLVLYPAQAQDANPARCWNWFKHNHHLRDRGEAAVIATMTQAVMKEHGINPAQVYVAGLTGLTGRSGRSGPSLRMPAIVFHGDHDATVHPKNGDQVIAAALVGAAAGPARAEQWLLHGARHAWSGGQAAGSYTDAKGPDASGEMRRFFFSQCAHAGH